MLAAVLALLILPEVDVNELLERVAKRYGEMKAYSLQVDEHDTVRVNSIRLDVDAKRYHYHSRLDAPGYKFPFELTIHSDGETVWRLDARLKRAFTEEPGLYSDRQVREAMKVHHQRYSMLDGPAMKAHLLKIEKKRGRQCAVVSVESNLKNAPATWVEKLWIDIENAAIVRAEMDSQSNIDGHREYWLREYLAPSGERPPDEKLLSTIPGERRRP